MYIYIYNIIYLLYVYMCIYVYLSIYLSIYILSMNLSIYMYISIIYVLYIYSKKKARLVLVKKTKFHIVKVRLSPLFTFQTSSFYLFQ